MRDKNTSSADFRKATKDIASFLCYEATRDLTVVEDGTVATPLVEAPNMKIKEEVAIIPILRAGLGVMDGFLDFLPSAQVWHIGLYRDPKTLCPVEYYNKLPATCTASKIYVVDPMLGTGGTAIATLNIMREWAGKDVQIKFVCILAAPEGIEAVTHAHPDVDIHVGKIDDKLNAKGYILPGVGDAGDRLYNAYAH
eukprot:CAMPEP_0113867016 /NCGR_PEP_ID=MMETSP0780_2-20120614/188_1 /TAXON_ID=652834 /ORGANISM="Palpitomonas bilix" /LENGTH=195 /DNA_ID=CAMNT_0000851919 /DNA_START=106 /DNA_END=693 /DNA_ORIENTATION=- /assembly_acc=CAM_ASM_000599